VPKYSPGKDKATRLEIRCPDPSSNPYLAFAVLLKSGLDGIKKKMQAPKPVEEDVFEFDMEQLEKHGIEVLPYSLWHAVRAIQKDEVIASTLGNDFMKKYVRAKMSEWDDFRIHVTDWEIDRYLDT
jgi:glutamine synthetase